MLVVMGFLLDLVLLTGVSHATLKSIGIGAAGSTSPRLRGEVASEASG